LNLGARRKIQKVISLASNVLEGFPTAFFLKGQGEEGFGLEVVESFSKKIKRNKRLDGGEGIVGWVFQEQNFSAPFLCEEPSL